MLNDPPWPSCENETEKVEVNMNREDAKEYTDTISLVAEGAYRQVALGIKWGIPKSLGISREEWVSRIGSIKMSIEDRREAVKELARNGHSNREIGDILGVDEITVRRDKEGDATNVAEHHKKPKEAMVDMGLYATNVADGEDGAAEYSAGEEATPEEPMTLAASEEQDAPWQGDIVKLAIGRVYDFARGYEKEMTAKQRCEFRAQIIRRFSNGPRG
jgi:hypothetical protein